MPPETADATDTPAATTRPTAAATTAVPLGQPQLLQRLGAVAAASALAACGGGHVGTPGPTSVATVADLPGNGGVRPASAASTSSQPGVSDAARFLTQATFGPASVDDIEAVREKGYTLWLWEQFNEPTTSHVSYLDWQRQRTDGLRANEDMSYEAIWQQWIFGADQLRARVAFALSQIIVISNVAPDVPPYAMSSWMDMMNRNAFGNYRTLLGEATLHAAMGYYLNMQGSEKDNARTGAHPNENYAREILQLFSVGLLKLNRDGSAVNASGQTVPTFDESVVQGFARAFTGWTVAFAQRFGEFDESRDDNWRTPMKPDPAYHEAGEKKLLDGVVLAAGGSPEQDLQAALDNIFNHPNVGPFICRQLIQRLVTSNPSAGYIDRVASVFNDNGGGTRGDLRAVVQAILLDAEARNPLLASDNRFGKLREPVVRFANVLRAMNAKSSSGINAIHELDNADNALGQSPLLAPSVFNFFSPNFRQAGAMAAAGMVAPEFQITTETTVVGSLNFFAKLFNNGGYGGGANRLVLDEAPWRALAATPEALVDRINLLFCEGAMGTPTRTRLLTLINAISANDTRKRVRQALILTTLSPDFTVQT